MLHPIANNKPTDTHFYVISAYLIKDFLTDWNVRRFVLHNHYGTGLSVINDSIATLLGIVQAESNLIGNTGRCIPFG